MIVRGCGMRTNYLLLLKCGADSVAYLFCCGRSSGGPEVRSHTAGVENGFHCAVNSISFGLEAERILEHRSHGTDRTQWVCFVLSRDVRSRAVHRLVQPDKCARWLLATDGS